MNHQINRLTGGTDITQPTHSLVINPMPSKRYKYNHQITDKAGSRSIPLRRYKDRVRSITANRAFDINPIPSERYNHVKLTITANRAFRGMAGLAVLYPRVLDYIGWRLKTLSASSTGL